MKWNEYVPKDERPIIGRLYKALLKDARGFELRLWDGEEWATAWTQSLSELYANTGHSDLTWVYWRVADEAKRERKREGGVFLVHGNGEDVVADGTAPTNAMLVDVERFMDIANGTVDA